MSPPRKHDDAFGEPARHLRDTVAPGTTGDSHDDMNDFPLLRDAGENPERFGERDRSNGQKRKTKTDTSNDQNVEVFWHGQVDYRESRPQLVQDVIPQVGHGLISGQWGTFKTFAALELAHSCMSGEPFLGYEIMRRGGVLFIALEGAGEVPIRLQGVIEDRGKIEGPAPFAWVETCPPLIGKNAADEICAIATSIAGELKARFGVPLTVQLNSGKNGFRLIGHNSPLMLLSVQF